MHRAWPRVLAVASGICLLGAPVLAHFAIATHRFMGVAGLLVAVQSGMLGWILAGQVAARRDLRSVARVALQSCVAGAIAALAIVVWRRSADGLVVASALPHALIYLGLLAVFAGSLSPGRVPVITVIAARARGRLDPVLLAYTRRVTIAWCAFFVAQLALSLGLWFFAPIAWWQVFLNLCTLPMLALMFGAELGYRSWRHGIHMPAGQGGALARMRHISAQFRAPLHHAEPKT